jgi:hypothetical protein
LRVTSCCGVCSWGVTGFDAAAAVFPFFEAVAPFFPSAAAIAFLALPFFLAWWTWIAIRLALICLGGGIRTLVLIRWLTLIWAWTAWATVMTVAVATAIPTVSEVTLAATLFTGRRIGGRFWRG